MHQYYLYYLEGLLGLLRQHIHLLGPEVLVDLLHQHLEHLWHLLYQVIRFPALLTTGMHGTEHCVG